MSSQSSHHHRLRVGFDLDGVLLYNPLRVARPFTHALTSLFKKKNKLSFYVPRSSLAQLAWKVIHYSSIYEPVSVGTLKSEFEKHHVDAYVITARFACLSGLFNRWRRKSGADETFVRCYQNLADEQPHLFKERMINELKLDFYIEDNWSIVKHLSQSTNTKILWVTNPLDKQLISYPYRFDSIEDALAEVFASNP